MLNLSTIAALQDMLLKEVPEIREIHFAKLKVNCPLAGEEIYFHFTVAPPISVAGDWKTFLSNPDDGDAINSLRRHEYTGRPLGDATFVTRIECKVQRILSR